MIICMTGYQMNTKCRIWHYWFRRWKNQGPHPECLSCDCKTRKICNPQKEILPFPSCALLYLLGV